MQYVPVSLTVLPVPIEQLYLQGREGLAARCDGDSNPAATARPSRHTEERAQQVVLPVPLAEKGETGVLCIGNGQQRLTKEALLAASPTARAALFTGLYILATGLALLVAPLSVFTLLFDQRCDMLVHLLESCFVGRLSLVNGASQELTATA